jgi:hypothetical protein
MTVETMISILKAERQRIDDAIVRIELLLKSPPKHRTHPARSQEPRAQKRARSHETHGHKKTRSSASSA